MDIESLFQMRNKDAEIKAILSWFVQKTVPDYLDQNSQTVVKNIKEDNPPPTVKELLKAFELTHQNRSSVIKALQ